MSLFDFDHTHPPIGEDGTPYGYFCALRDETVETNTNIGWSTHHGGFWVATGYDVCREIFHNTKDFSNRGVTFPAYDLGEGATLLMAGQDAPEHKKYRGMVQGPFSPRKVMSFNDHLIQMTHDLIDEFIEDGEVDLVDALTDNVPARMTAIILGISPEDGDLYRKWTWAMTHLFLTDPELAGEHIKEMDEYFIDVLKHRRKNLGDDVLSLVIQSTDPETGEKLTDQEIKDFFIILLLGGIENTSKLLSTMFWHLCVDSDLRGKMQHLRGEGMLLAMDEFLRFYTPAYLARLIVNDVEVDGVRMEAGGHVVTHLQTANRDSRKFDRPDDVILDRENNRHLGLGLGVHRCLGAHLVRYEGQIVAEAMLDRVPDFDLDPDKPPVWITGQVGGMSDVHLKFEPGKRRNANLVGAAS